MRTMWRRLPGGWLVSELVPGDAEAIARHLADGSVARWTLRIPYPYHVEDARTFLSAIKAHEKTLGRTTHFAIRENSGELIGIVGFEGVPALYSEEKTPVELGFWIAPSHWRRGIAKAAIERLVNMALVEYEIDALTARVLEGNAGSQRVLTANGFRPIETEASWEGPAGPRKGTRFGITYEEYAKIHKAKS